MGSFHPQAGNAGNPWGGITASLARLAARVGRVEARPPVGLLNAHRIDTPPPSTSSADDTGLWRIPPGFPGTSILLGLTAGASGTAVGELSIQNGRGTDIDRRPIPFSGDLGPFPATSGQIVVSAVRTAGTGSVWVDVLAVRYGPHLADDFQSALDPDIGQETPTSDDPSSD